MRKSFKFRLVPNSQQAAALERTLDAHRRLYNAALEQRKTAWKRCRVGITFYQQSAELKDIRRDLDVLDGTNFTSCEATLRRLDRAFQAFFRRVKSGEKAVGYPRFKGRNRFDTVEFKAGNGCKWSGWTIYFQHVGHVKVRLHRPVEGVIKTLNFKREADGWYVIASCDVPDMTPVVSDKPPVGIDLGLSAFLATSDGALIPPPQYFRHAQKALRRAQRALSRKQRGSQRRDKARQRVARLHQHVSRQRRDWHFKTAKRLTDQYGTVYAEDLNIKGLARSRLAKSVLDAGWGQFLSILGRKVEETCGQLILVNPYNTSQVCSACGALPDIPKTLSTRVHRCPCGCVLDRDINAALNIKARGMRVQARTGPLGSVA